jgi:hypothetical protein
LKEVDTVRNSHILKYFMWVFPFLAVLGLVLKGGLGILIAIPVSAAVSVVSVMISGLIGGGSVNVLYGTGRKNIDVRDQLSGTMSQARCHKMSQDYDRALAFVGEVIDKDPDYPEALFLKAQILWEGFRDSNGAKECLSQVINIVPNKSEPLHRWASQLLLEIN